MKNTYLIILSSLLVLNLLTGCKGKEGAPGPQGVPGPAGVQGPAGPSASSYIVPVTFGTINTYTEYLGLQGKIDVNDAVIVYGNFYNYSSERYWAQLPYSTNDINFYYEVSDDGKIFFNAEKDGLIAFTSPTTYSFRIVVIQGQAGARLELPEIDFSSYREVKAYYNLPE